MPNDTPPSQLTIQQVLAGLPPEFGFFAERYATQIQPALAARETERAAAATRLREATVLAVLVGLVIAGFGMALLRHPAVIVVGVMAGFGIYAWGGMPLRRLGRETKEMLVDPVTAQFGLSYEMAPGDPADILRFRELGLVPRWDRARFEDKLTGKRQDAPFEFFEAHLEEKREESDSRGNSRTEWTTVFRGQCLIARFPKPFNGVTKVERDHGAMNFLTKFGAGMPRVKLEDPVFEKNFEVYGTDQVEARYILTPDFMERLLALEKTFGGKQLRCAFEGGEMLLAVEGKNLFEPGSMLRRMDDLGRVSEMLHDFAAVFLVIDAMVAVRTPEALRGSPPS